MPPNSTSRIACCIWSSVLLRGPAVHPARHAGQHLQRLGVARQRVHVVKPRHHLVHGVEGRPDIDGVLVEAVVELGGIGAEIAALIQLCLAFGQSRHQRVAALFQFHIARAGIAQRAGRKIMAGEMAAQFAGRFFPAAQRRALEAMPALMRKVCSSRSGDRRFM